ncbi:MAG: diaminopimelate epimerase [Deltaproteobacteria bacterium]|nr:MAG: diaminopimelate epimerase [Deltaproteobacteria bacterium]
MRLVRSHGLGNDYLVLHEGPPASPALVRALCDRHRGVGGDGVLEPTPTGRADHGVTIWNPDGSVAEKSGNGLRIFARYLVDHLGAPERFSVDTGAEVVGCTVQGDRISIAMGRATIEPAQVPVHAREPVIDATWQVGGQTLQITALATGNPHLVTFVDGDLDALDWRRLGPLLENHASVPNRANVQFVKVLAPDRLEIRIWERGAGPTLASGSSSCAAVCAAMLTHRIPPGRVTVQMPGGELTVTLTEALDLVLEGPVEVVGEFAVDPRWLLRRAARAAG